MEFIESERGKQIVGGNYPRGVIVWRAIVRGAIVLLQEKVIFFIACSSCIILLMINITGA
jgi:hypothetical protein